MAIDFEHDYGVNAGYVQALFDQWQTDPGQVEESWQKIFQSSSAAAPPAAESSKGSGESASAGPEDDPELTRLKGIAGRIATNMTASLELPTATSVRTLGAKVMVENRLLLNEHLKVRAYGKASFTHLLAWALVQALKEQPQVQSSFEKHDGKSYARLPQSIGLGLAVDVPSPGGRMLVVPSIKGCEALSFVEFYEAYEDLVARAREGQLTSADYAGTTVTLTNPGGFGTSMSVPRLMPGQGLIIAAGSIGVPPELMGASGAALAELALGPVTTLTSTYDHRVVQGAESGLLLRRMDQLLQGEHGFYDGIFEAFRVPWTPARAAQDKRSIHGRDEARMQAQVWSMVNAYRSRGHRLADLDPLGYKPQALPSLDPAHYGFSVWDLDRTFQSSGIDGSERMTLREILAAMRRAYCRRWTVEYMHITDRFRKHWIRDRVESSEQEQQFDSDDRRRILSQLYRAENFERFLATRYVGNKRFSLEGGDTLIPALLELLERAAIHGIERVVIGMAHRGRLNVLVNVMGKSYKGVFAEFEAVMLPLSQEGSGDVKYHLGQQGTFTSKDGRQVEVLLSANPSHLEAVDPVVCGMTRAWQDAGGDSERKRALAVLIHGDAAFSGQGVVAETFNMSELRAFSNGGTVHIVVNNQIGFTAGPKDLRSTYSCTDVAKGVEAPVLHANGDFPESVLRAVGVAVDYRHEFGGDAVINMVCYRRHGHNEGDEPAYTQPTLYARIAGHPTVANNYRQLLVRRGELEEAEAEAIGQEFDLELRAALDQQRAEAESTEALPAAELLDYTVDDEADYAPGISPETGVPAERLVAILDELNAMPADFVTHPNLLRQLRRRERMVRGEQDLDWGCAEALAYGTLLLEGIPIRLTGQDSGRGTFSHRHAVIRDQVTEAEHVPLAKLESGANFQVWDSLLSEEAVLGFEYGYALESPEALTLWEAQFGDFVNGAQVMIDQFLAASEAKWRQTSGLVMLLPHGYDGQGAEHSSARPERFLALCSDGNMSVINCTTSAQFFHLLRRQGMAETKRMMVVLTPKSLLRDKRAASPIEDLAQGRFHELIPDQGHVGDGPHGDVKRLLLCSGKVYYELRDELHAAGRTDIAIARLEQLYPFPSEAMAAELSRFPDAELVWVQEEPRNMGAWSFILQRAMDLGWKIRYAGRPQSSAPATGSHSRHKYEQAHLLAQALE